MKERGRAGKYFMAAVMGALWGALMEVSVAFFTSQEVNAVGRVVFLLAGAVVGLFIAHLLIKIDQERHCGAIYVSGRKEAEKKLHIVTSVISHTDSVRPIAPIIIKAMMDQLRYHAESCREAQINYAEKVKWHSQHQADLETYRHAAENFKSQFDSAERSFSERHALFTEFLAFSKREMLLHTEGLPELPKTWQEYLAKEEAAAS